MSSVKRTLILVRHAHRKKLGPNPRLASALDNGISTQGRAQAKRVRDRFVKTFGPKAQPTLLSSPKLRCLETLAPLAKKLDAAIEIRLGLDESPDPIKQARAFLQRWKKSRCKTTVICSHGDVLPALLKLTLGAPIELDKGAWCVLEWDSAGFRVASLLQRP
jgi:broad specificity phosphatase PhoE